VTKKMSRAEKIRVVNNALRERAAEDRRKQPHLYVKPTDEVLFVENVAQLLGCSVDYVRRISRRELPAARCGARLQYLREDVVAYVRRHRDDGAGALKTLQTVSRTAHRDDGAQDYDPVSDSRGKMGGKPRR
jgi:AraC-like DNA-binding protein